jgi:hypothetical protein
MRSKIHVVLIAVAVMGASSTAMAKGAGGGGWSHGGHGHFGHRFHFVNRFNRNPFLLGGWGWGLDGWGPYGEGNTTTVVAFPQATPQPAGVTGSIAATPCHLSAETFTVPSSAGGTRQVQIVACR